MKPNSTKMEKINKWGPILFFLVGGLGIGALGIKGSFDKGVSLSDLERISGDISEHTIIDNDHNHEITIHVNGQNNPFVFNGVDWFPTIKPVLVSAKKTEMWVEKHGNPRRIYQMSLDGNKVVAIDDWNRETVSRGKFLTKMGGAMTLVGALLFGIINIKDSVLSNKLFKIVGSILFLAASLVRIYLGFVK